MVIKNTQGWPQNPDAAFVDKSPSIMGTLDTVKAATVDVVSCFDNVGLVALHGVPMIWNSFKPEVQAYIEARMSGTVSMGPSLNMVSVTSAAERAIQIERLRAEIPAEDLIKLALVAVATGRMPGSDELVKPADRLKTLMMLLNKALPDSKSVELDERAERSDKRRRSLKDTTQKELAEMTEAQLRDLIQREKDDEEKQ